LWELDGDQISPKKWSWNHLQCLEVHTKGSPICTKIESIKYYISRCPLVGTCLPIVQIDHENFSSRSLNLGTPNVVKNPKPQSVTNYQN